MNDRSWSAIKRLVYERTQGCCEYCQTSEANIGQAMHIDPLGGNSPDNLCLSCANCNLSKAKVTTAVDPETGKQVPLFNPRTQIWLEHFKWIDDDLRVYGLTPVGRATIQRLKMNQERVLIARRPWMMDGFHPPNLIS